MATSSVARHRSSTPWYGERSVEPHAFVCRGVGGRSRSSASRPLDSPPALAALNHDPAGGTSRARYARVHAIRVVVVGLAGGVLHSSAAHADLPRCSQAHADLVYSAQDLPDAHGDTGWFPAGSPAQLRLTGQLTGQTTVAMSLTPTACWGDGMMITAPGIAGSGLLDSRYGAEFQVLGQIHTSILGYAIDWEGQVPLPYWLPSNFLMAGTTSFDPAALPDSLTPVVAVTSNDTSPVVLVSTDVLSEIIDLAGISGGLRLTAQGVMTTSYRTDSISIAGATLASASAQASIAEPRDGFARSLGAAISASGVVRYDPSIVLAAHFYVSILHITVVDWDLASVTVPLPGIDRSVQLTAPQLAIPLPRLDPIPTSLGFASGASQALALHNAGDMALAVQLDSALPGVTATPITIPPGQDGVLQVTVDPTLLDGRLLVLATNDPSHPSVSVTVDANQQGETTMPAPGDHEAGCSAQRGDSTWLVLLAIGACVARVGRRR
jgi:hypothetical protein